MLRGLDCFYGNYCIEPFPWLLSCIEGFLLTNRNVRHVKKYQRAFSRACFLASPLGLRTDELSGNFEDALLEISERIDEEQWLDYVNSVWALWRCRNDRAYSSKQPDFQLFFKYLSMISRESKAGATRGFGGVTNRSPRAVVLTEIQNEYNRYFMALKESVLIAIGLGIEVSSFRSDCLELVNICLSSQPPINAKWNAFEEILQVWYLLQEHKSFSYVHILRSQNDLADNLAKGGRMNGWDYVGHTFPCFKF